MVYGGATVGDVRTGIGIITRILSAKGGAQGTIFAEDQRGKINQFNLTTKVFV
jgi:hypothetical protein